MLLPGDFARWHTYCFTELPLHDKRGHTLLEALAFDGGDDDSEYYTSTDGGLQLRQQSEQDAFKLPPLFAASRVYPEFARVARNVRRLYFEHWGAIQGFDRSGGGGGWALSRQNVFRLEVTRPFLSFFLVARADKCARPSCAASASPSFSRATATTRGGCCCCASSCSRGTPARPASATTSSVCASRPLSRRRVTDGAECQAGACCTSSRRSRSGRTRRSPGRGWNGPGPESPVIFTNNNNGRVTDLTTLYLTTTMLVSVARVPWPPGLHLELQVRIVQFLRSEKRLARRLCPCQRPQARKRAQ